MTSTQSGETVAKREHHRPPRIARVQKSTQLAWILAFAAAVIYAVFVLNPANRGDLGPYLVLVVAEVILLANTFATGWTIEAGARRNGAEDPEIERARQALLSEDWQPTVDVLVPVYGEPLEVIAHTVTKARDLTLAHRTIVCDDADHPEVAALARTLGVDYVSRADNDGAKAGNLNNAIALSEGEFIAVFDADHAPDSDFLLVMLPYLANPDVGFVQSPQSYRNLSESAVSDASASNQRVFYELVCPGKNAFDAQFHVGTNAVLRREAIESIGGYPSHSRSEDIWASLQMHRGGWSSVYVPHVMAQGLAPTTMLTHLRQQERWAAGAFEVLFHGRPWRRDSSLTADQRIQYMLPPLHFLQAAATQMFLLLPALFILFGVEPIAAPGGTWLLRFLPLFLLTQLATLLQLGRWKPWWMAVSTASAPAHLLALLRVITGRAASSHWFVSNSSNHRPWVVEYMPLQIITLVANAAAIVVGLVVFERPLDTSIALGLCAIHSAMLLAVLGHAVRDRRRPPAGASSTPPLVIDLTDSADVAR